MIFLEFFTFSATHPCVRDPRVARVPHAWEATVSKDKFTETRCVSATATTTYAHQLTSLPKLAWHQIC